MVAILNYYKDPRLSEQIAVKVGDKVKAHKSGEEFYLTEDKEYEVLFINAINMISVLNDRNEVEIYSVEYFR